jgi:hypothetical protein
MAIPSYKAVLKHYASLPADVQQFFVPLPSLIESYDWDVCIALQFIRVETAQNRTIYGGVVKLHRANAEIADSMLYSLHVTRASFLKLIETIFGAPLPVAIADKLKFAEKIRDKTVHARAFQSRMHVRLWWTYWTTPRSSTLLWRALQDFVPSGTCADSRAQRSHSKSQRLTGF